MSTRMGRPHRTRILSGVYHTPATHGSFPASTAHAKAIVGMQEIPECCLNIQHICHTRLMSFGTDPQSVWIDELQTTPGNREELSEFSVKMFDDKPDKPDGVHCAFLHLTRFVRRKLQGLMTLASTTPPAFGRDNKLVSHLSIIPTKLLNGKH